VDGSTLKKADGGTGRDIRETIDTELARHGYTLSCDGHRVRAFQGWQEHSVEKNSKRWNWRHRENIPITS
jgi:hypothetical protein